MNFSGLMQLIESSSEDDWTEVDASTADGLTQIAIFNDDVAISLAWGIQHMNGESWEEPWSAGFPDSKIYGYYLDVRFNGVPVCRDLVLSVDGGRAYLPSGHPLAEENTGIIGATVKEPEWKRARLLDLLTHKGHSEFDDYAKRANIQLG